MTKKATQKLSTTEMVFLRRSWRVSKMKHITNEEIKKRMGIEKRLIEEIQTRKWLGRQTSMSFRMRETTKAAVEIAIMYIICRFKSTFYRTKFRILWIWDNLLFSRPWLRENSCWGLYINTRAGIIFLIFIFRKIV